MKEKLVGFDGYVIYRVYVEKQNRVIRVKYLQIFEDIATKRHLALPNFDKKPTFGKIQLSDAEKDTLSSKLATSEEEIKNKRRVDKTILSPVKRPKLTPPVDKSKKT